MRPFTFQIKHQSEGYFFALYPNNIPNQDIGRSPVYESIDLCKKALENFRIFVKDNQIANDASPFVHIEKREQGFYFTYKKNGEVLFFRRLGYTTKQNCKDGIGSIWKHIDAQFV